MKELDIESKAKNVLNMIISRMFNVKSKLKDTDEFTKANIIPKTIRVESNGRIIESMSFPYFKFDEVMNTDFEDSDLPEIIIKSKVKSMYEKTQEVVRTGNIVNYIDERGRRITNFPGMSDNGVCHVRPHGRDSRDTISLPVKDKVTGAIEFTKQCFWFNNSYLKEIISEFL